MIQLGPREVTLSPKQRQIAALVALGLTSRQIAVRIGWRSHTAVNQAISRIGTLIPGAGRARVRIAVWWTEQRRELCDLRPGKEVASVALSHDACTSPAQEPPLSCSPTYPKKDPP